MSTRNLTIATLGCGLVILLAFMIRLLLVDSGVEHGAARLTAAGDGVEGAALAPVTGAGADPGGVDGPALRADPGGVDGPALRADPGGVDGPALEAGAASQQASRPETVSGGAEPGGSAESAEVEAASKTRDNGPGVDDRTQQAPGPTAPAASAEPATPSPDAPLPDTAGSEVAHLSFNLFEGGTGTLGHYHGRPLVVNFFASWCPPCIVEMPEFQAAFEELGGEVAFLGLAVDDDPADSAAIVEATGVTYDLGVDVGSAVFKALDGLGMPTSVFITAQGEVNERFSGMLTKQALRERVERISG